MSTQTSFGTTKAPADVRVKVLDTYFLVHSVFLKQFSVYFSRFLDSPDKQDSSNGSAGYKYDWTTKIDEIQGEMDWFLVAITTE